MKKIMAILFFSLLFFSGCTKKTNSESYSIGAISLQGTKHMPGQSYAAYIPLSENAINSSLNLTLLDNGVPSDSLVLNDSAAIENGKATLMWNVHSDGEHTLEAVLYDNGTEAASRSVSISAVPLGLKEEDFAEVEFWNEPVEKALLQAQAFDLQTSIEVKKAGVYMKYFVAPTSNSTVTVQLRRGAVDGAVLAEASFPSSSLGTEFEWQFLSFPAVQLGPGRYWLVMQRSEATGTVVWRRGPGNLIGTDDDSMTLDNTRGQQGSWQVDDVDFTFQVSSQD
ncbi:MAG: hypothetical protein PHY95_04365 [Candidatus ainarchaeum sp.]|nr:hypothetical protein [Candidatus ainarchaeum sp.]